MARLQIRGLKVFGHHGVHEAERARGQFFLIDLKISLSKTPESDALAETIDYIEIMREVESLSASRSFRLLEKFAEAIALKLLEKFDRIIAADIRVRKRILEAGVDVEWAAAQIKLSR